MRSLIKKKDLGVRLHRAAGSWRVRIGALIAAGLIIGVVVFAPEGNVFANARGDGALVYGVTANTTPQARTYSGASDSVSSASGTVAGTNPQNMVIRASSTKQEMIAGYTDSSGTLQIMCYTGTSWSNEWSVSVGGTGTTKRFDIAYETNTGDVTVLYSTNNTTSNELGYRTKSGGTGCGTANWSSATNLDPVRTANPVAWVKLAADRRGSSDLLTAVWADTSAVLSAMQWSGSAWGNEPTTALESSLECVGTTGSCTSGTTPQTQILDVDYESVSGDVMVVWGAANGTNGVNGARYAICTGGTSSCSWTNVGQIAGTGTGLADDAHVLDLAANPNTDEMSFASIGDGGDDLQAAYWSGTAWVTQGNVDTSCQTPLAGKQFIATSWFTSGTATRRLVTYADSTGSTIAYVAADGSANLPANSPSTFTTSPVMNGANRNWYDLQGDPFNRDRAMLTASDTDGSSNVRLFAKRIVMSAAGTFTLTNSDGSATLSSNMGAGTTAPFGFAYWRATSTYTQAAYRWYANANALQPTTALANQNTSYSTGSNSTILRLRMGLSIGTADMDAGSQNFKLQVASSTSGPWSDVGNPPDAWCNDTTGITCTTSWSSRRKITVDNSASASNLTNYPMLVRLDSTRIDYGKTQAAGQDLRFVDPSDPNTVLPYEIEKWNSSGSSYVWVKIPQIDGSSTSDHIWMYYGNGSIGDGQDKNNVWDSSFRAVYHSHETSGTAMSDSTTNNNASTKTSSTSPNPTTSGQVGGAQVYDGSSSIGSAATNASLNLSTFTLSAWVNATSIGGGNYRSILCKDASFSPNYCLQVNSSSQAAINYCTGSVGSCSYPSANTTTTLSTGTWYFVTGTFDGSTLRIYLNGTSGGSSSGGAPVTSTGPLYLGRSSWGEFWSGTIDEGRVSTGARSADWIRADYLSQTDAMLSYSSEQSQGGLSATGAWQFYNGNNTVTNGTTISSALLGGTTALESYQAVNPTVANPNTASIGGQAEWDFSLDPSGVCGGNFYFRMVKGDGTAFTSYTTYPTLIINLPAHVPVDKAMRHGAWFNNETKQPYGCDWISN